MICNNNMIFFLFQIGVKSLNTRLPVRAGPGIRLFQGKINLHKVAAIALILAGVVVFFWE